MNFNFINILKFEQVNSKQNENVSVVGFQPVSIVFSQIFLQMMNESLKCEQSKIENSSPIVHKVNENQNNISDSESSELSEISSSDTLFNKAKNFEVKVLPFAQNLVEFFSKREDIFNLSNDALINSKHVQIDPVEGDRVGDSKLNFDFASILENPKHSDVKIRSAIISVIKSSDEVISSDNESSQAMGSKVLDYVDVKIADSGKSEIRRESLILSKSFDEISKMDKKLGAEVKVKDFISKSEALDREIRTVKLDLAFSVEKEKKGDDSAVDFIARKGKTENNLEISGNVREEKVTLKENFKVVSPVVGEKKNVELGFAELWNKTEIRSDLEKVSDGVVFEKRVNVSDVIDVVKNSVLESKDLSKNFEITLKLEPKELGEIVVKISHGENGVKVLFEVKNAEVKQLIEAGMNNLKTMLESSNVNLEKIGVVFGDLNLNSEGSSREQMFKKFSRRKNVDFSGSVRIYGGSLIEAII